MRRIEHGLWTRLLGLVLALGATGPGAAATFALVSEDAPGEGLNDPTPVAPLPDNPGTTRGAQRRFVVEQAFALWGQRIRSNTTILVSVDFEPLPCQSTQATLGVGGPTSIFENFPNAPLADTWYPSALADALAGQDLDPGYPDIQISINSDVDVECGGLSGGWHYGTDARIHHATDHQYLMLTVLHEVAHGLGFTSSVFLATGETPFGHHDVWSHFVVDDVLGKRWSDMTNAERAASAIRYRSVFFDGPYTQAARKQLVQGNQWSVRRPVGAGWSSTSVQISHAKQSGLVDGVELQASCRRIRVENSTECLSPSDQADIAGKVVSLDFSYLPSPSLCTVGAALRTSESAGSSAIFGSFAGTSPTQLTIPAFNGGISCLATDPPLRIVQGGALDARADNRALLFTPVNLAPSASVLHLAPEPVAQQLMTPEIESNLWHGLDWTLPILRDLGWPVPIGINLAPALQGELNAPEPWSRKILLDTIALYDEIAPDTLATLRLTLNPGDWDWVYDDAPELLADSSEDGRTIALSGKLRHLGAHLGRGGLFIQIADGIPADVEVTGTLSDRSGGSPPLASRDFRLTKQVFAQNIPAMLALPANLQIDDSGVLAFQFESLFDPDDVHGIATLELRGFGITLKPAWQAPAIEDVSDSYSAVKLRGPFADLARFATIPGAFIARPNGFHSSSTVTATLNDGAPAVHGSNQRTVEGNIVFNIENAVPIVQLPVSIHRFPGESFVMPYADYQDDDATTRVSLRVESTSGGLTISNVDVRSPWSLNGTAADIRAALNTIQASGDDGNLNIEIEDREYGTTQVNTLNFSIPMVTDPDGLFRNQFE